MKHLHYLGLLTVAVINVGCNINFEEPVYNPPEINVDPSPYLGEWDLVAMAGEAVDPGKFHLSVSQVGGATLAVACSGEGREAGTHSFELTLLESTVIVSVQHTEQTWRVFKAELGEEGSQLAVQALNYQTVKADVLSEVIPGQVKGAEVGGLFEWIDVGTSGTETRTYLEERPDVFVSEYVFNRSSP